MCDGHSVDLLFSVDCRLSVNRSVHLGDYTPGWAHAAGVLRTLSVSFLLKNSLI